MMVKDWQFAKISADGTYHVIDNIPLYEKRFLDVLNYHPPGFAAVLSNDGAYHIDTHGKPLYQERFQRTFGFYDSKAAVIFDNAWFHINPEGKACYDERYTWCGNYQDGVCTIRDNNGLYFHIDGNGKPLYLERYRYAGDFREGIAVVQNKEGKSSHIDLQGSLTHNCWFLDLDVFHKGFARAKDHLGWMHIDCYGQPIYEHRFVMVEPFYNGYARVETADGTFWVINELGEIQWQLRNTNNQ